MTMYAVGIDVSKTKSTIAITTIDGNILEKPFDVLHHHSEITSFITKLKKYPCENLKIVLEATSHYHLPILLPLIEHGFFVCVENPFVIKKYCDTDLRRVKTDQKDALKLCKYCSEKWHSLKAYKLKDSLRHELTFLSREYSKYVQTQTRLKIQLSDLVDKTFAGLKEAINAENRYPLFLKIYEKYWHPDIVLSYRKEDFISEIVVISKSLGHRVGNKIGLKIYELAPTVITLRPNNSITQLATTSCIQLLNQSILATNTIIAKMEELAKSLPEYHLVDNMMGVGPKTRTRLIAEIGDITRFRNANCLIAFCGIDTPPYQSGSYSAKERHITKRGSKHLRKVGYEVMRNLKTSRPKEDNDVYHYILKKEAEGKPKKVAKIAGLNKFLRIYYARVMGLYSAS